MSKTYLTKQEKLKRLKTIVDETLPKISRTKNDWRDFLKFNAKFYKYSFSEVLHIHEQAPNATACGEIKHWNKVGRRVHKGTEGIPVFNETDRQQDIRYVFDVSDTYGEERGIAKQWALQERHKDAVLEELQKRFSSKSPTAVYDKNLKWAVEEFTNEACIEYLEGIQYDIEGSRLEDLDFDNIVKEFRETVVDSVGYLVCERLGIEKGLYDNDEIAFEYLKDFDTKSTMIRLGVAINHLSKSVLEIVQKTILKEIEKERMLTNGEQRIETRTSQEGIANDGRGNRGNGEQSTAGKQSTVGQIRNTDLGLSQGTSAEQISILDDGANAFRDMSTRGTRSNRDERSDRSTVEEADTTTNRRLHGDSTLRGNDTQSSGGNRSERGSVQEKVVNLFETEESTTKEPLAPTEPSGSFFNFKNRSLYIRESLLHGSQFENSKKDVYEYFENGDKDRLDYAKFLSEQYRSGESTIDFSDGTTATLTVSRGGASINFGSTSGSPIIRLLWDDLAREIEKLVKNAEYYNTEEQEPDYTNEQLQGNLQEANTEQNKPLESNDFENFENYISALRSNTADYTEPFVAIEWSESNNFAEGEILSFSQADKKFKEVEKLEREERVEQGRLGGYHKTKGIVFYLGDPSLNELSTYQFRYDIGDYDEQNSGLFNHMQNFWNNAEKSRNDVLYSLEDIENAKHMLSLLQDYKFENTKAILDSGKEESFDLWEEAEPQIENAVDSNVRTVAPDKITTSITTEESGQSQAQNFHITMEDGVGKGTPKQKYRQNVQAIEVLNTLESENRVPTHEEQSILATYSGWGGLAMAFDERNESWQKEYVELKELLSEKEYEAAISSTLNAHFTGTEIIEGIYQGLEHIGFKGGNVLEPSMGVGNFFGMMPESLANNSKLFGVELDSITGRIAKQLYPNANIQIQGFETNTLPDNFFDVAIGNVPFGDYKLHDPKYNKYNMMIHDYFFCKALDHVRPGGVVAFITSKGTMDKANTSVRRYIAERAELLGAIRLPNDAFKQSAGTEVTSDILFLKKRDRIIETSNEDWITSTKNLDGHQLNEFYVDKPHMMLGNLVMKSGPFGQESTLESDGRNLKEALLEAIQFLPKDVLEATTQTADLSEFEDDTPSNDTRIPVDPTVKNFCFTVVDGDIYQRVNSSMEKKEFSKTVAERVKGMIELRQITRNILDRQLEGCSDEELSGLQVELNKKYDTFFKKFGSINSKYNHRQFGDDADFPLLSAIEEIGDDETVKKASIFSKRTISPIVKPDHADTAVEALSISLNERGYVDIGFMSSLASKTNEEIIEDLKGIIFKNPEYDEPDNESNLFIGWETSDEYLSGNVRDKLMEAEQIAERNPFYLANVESLRAIQPKPLEAHEISVRIGASWVDKSYYRQFIFETLKPPSREHDSVRVHYTNHTGNWTIEKPSSRSKSIEAIEQFGTKRMDAYELFELTLNQKSPKIFDTVEDDDGNKKQVLNHKETIAIREKQTQLKQSFKNWIFDEPERRERLCSTYNRLFNSTRLRQFDGEHLTFPGMAPEISLRKHQKDAVARVLYGGNSLLAHCVGAGKTYTMATAAIELRRIGLAKKPCLVVPNHLVLQWANEFQRLYPTANILAASKKDFEKHNRQRFCGRIATGDWDAIIIGHSQFEKIPMSKERQQVKFESQISDIKIAIREAEEAKGEHITVKELQRALKGSEFALAQLHSSSKDNLVTFEQTGIDTLFVDESHYYKNKFIFTKMNNVAGLSKASAKKSTDMDMKCDYINELNGSERGVVFATGTPVSNSMVEMYTVQSYLQKKELEKVGLQHFDNWAADFGEVVSALELAPSGQGYRMKERFAKFVNLPELMNMYRMTADIQTSDMLKLPVPKLKSEKPITIAIEATPDQKAYVQELVSRSQAIYDRRVRSDVDNMLCVTNDGRNGALDMRCIDGGAFDYPDSKVNTCVKNVLDIYNDTKENKSTQMIFCDLSTPKGGKSFSVYDDMKAKFIAQGVPEKEIMFIHDANSNEQKEKIFAQVRAGEIRILMGSTQKMGAGTNCQTKLLALHNIDCPYRPSDLEQRMGRIVRQGNLNPEVQVYNYVTKGTFDAYLWQIVENKQKFISQVMTGNNPTRNMEDIDETVLNFAEVKAIATGNPKIRRKMELDLEVARLQVLESQHKASKYKLEDKVLKEYPKSISVTKDIIKGFGEDLIKRGNIESVPFSIKLGKKEFTERKDAGELLLKAIQGDKHAGKDIGSIHGFVISLQKSAFNEYFVQLKGSNSYKVELSNDSVGCIMRIENALRGLENSLSEKQEYLSDLQQQIESAKEHIKRPFDNEQELQDVLVELNEINAELSLDNSAEEVVLSKEDDEEDVLELDEGEEDDFEV